MESETLCDQISLGVKAMDEDHRELLETIQALEEAAANGDSRPGPLLDKLTLATRGHFAAEEAVMTRLKYPGLTMHSFKHQYLLDQIGAFVSRYTKTDAALNKHALNFLRDWLITHIQKEDRNFALWLDDQNKKQQSPDQSRQ